MRAPSLLIIVHDTRYIYGYSTQSASLAPRIRAETQRHLYLRRECEAKWAKDLVLDYLVRELAATLESYGADDSVQRGHEHRFYAGASEVVRLQFVSL